MRMGKGRKDEPITCTRSIFSDAGEEWAIDWHGDDDGSAIALGTGASAYRYYACLVFVADLGKAVALGDWDEHDGVLFADSQVEDSQVEAASFYHRQDRAEAHGDRSGSAKIVGYHNHL